MKSEALVAFLIGAFVVKGATAQEDSVNSTVNEIHSTIWSQFSLFPFCDSGAGDDFDTFLMTQQNNLDVAINPNNISLQFATANKACVFVVLGGFLETSNCTATRSVAQKALDAGCTVIFPDWQRAARPDCYILADPNDLTKALSCYVREVRLVRWVGEKIADLLVKICREAGIDPSAITIFSFSLGGHVSGRIGRAFEAEYGEKIGKMIVIDPAGPLYSLPLISPCALVHVGSGDASCVIFFSSNAGVFGTTNTMAADKTLVINGGTFQKDCDNVLDTRGIVAYLLCCHGYGGRVWMAMFSENLQVDVRCQSLGLCLLYPKILFTLDCEKPLGVFNNRKEITDVGFYDKVKYDQC